MGDCPSASGLTEPVAATAPSVMSLPDEQHQTAGRAMTLLCPSQAYPVPTFRYGIGGTPALDELSIVGGWRGIHSAPPLQSRWRPPRRRRCLCRTCTIRRRLRRWRCCVPARPSPSRSSGRLPHTRHTCPARLTVSPRPAPLRAGHSLGALRRVATGRLPPADRPATLPAVSQSGVSSAEVQVGSGGERKG